MKLSSLAVAPWTLLSFMSSIGLAVAQEGTAVAATAADNQARLLFEDSIDIDVDGDNPSTNIIGGIPADPGEYPSFVKSNGYYLCGATLIWEDIFLTAAHCDDGTFDQPNGKALIGATKLDGSDARETIPIDRVVSHPDYTYDSDAIENDIMLVVLKSPSTSSLSKGNADPMVPADDETVTVIGFGVTSEDGPLSFSLLEAKLHIVNFDVCNAANGGKLSEDQHLCAAADGKDTCGGDSGGPALNTKGDIVGITSFGIGCARPEYPGVYTRVSFFNEWILEGICLYSANPPSDEICAPFLPPPNQCRPSADCDFLGRFEGSRLHLTFLGGCIEKCFSRPGLFLRLGWNCGKCD